MKIWTCGITPRSGFRNAWTRIKNVNDVSRLSNFWIFFGAIQMTSCRDWWPWMKPGYITVTQRQNNNQWSGLTPPPKISSAKIRWKSSRLDFLGIKTASSSLIVFHRAKLSTRSISHLCCYNLRIVWRKTSTWSSAKESCSCTTNSVSPGNYNTEKTSLTVLPISRSPNLLYVHGPIRIPPAPLTEYNKRKFAIFVLQRGHCSRGVLVQRTIIGIYLVAWQIWINGLRNLLIFIGSMLNKSRVWSM